MNSFAFVTIHYSDGAGHFCQPLYVAIQAGAHHHPQKRSVVYALYTFTNISIGFSSVLSAREFHRISDVIEEDYSSKLLIL